VTLEPSIAPPNHPDQPSVRKTDIQFDRLHRGHVERFIGSAKQPSKGSEKRCI
jgi:hypothetical protein